MDARLQQHPVNEGHLRVGPLVEVPGVLQEWDIDPAEIMSNVGLDMMLLSDSENTILFADVGRLLNLCAAQTGCPYFGLLIGQRSGPDCLGLIGLVV
jgi:hypothetical protein